ncbi:YlaH-like family protein [Paenibacillus sp. y28]|uniref:YlaH-like family protein n=1 Tax=Paenibacillus sp. y28 TaxID=3129110 RepID=UPI0030163CB9
MQAWFVSHPFWTYVIIYVFVAYVYIKVFRVRRLPLLKEFIVYVLLGVGVIILWLFQMDLGLPIIISLGVAILLMLIVRIRFWVQAKLGKK